MRPHFRKPCNRDHAGQRTGAQPVLSRPGTQAAAVSGTGDAGDIDVRMVRVAASVRADQRGIALQTAIIMTTLIAIALAVSAVMYTRGGEVVDDLERQRLTKSPSSLTTQVLCEAYEFTWDSVTDTCS